MPNKITGGKPGPGRPKGSRNKTTAILKDALLLAADKAGGKEGMVGYLVAQARANPAAFLSILKIPIGTALAIWTLVTLLGYRNTTLYDQL